MSSKLKEDARQKNRREAASSREKEARIIIVPLDGTPHAAVALPVAKTLAELERAVLHVIHIREPILPPREVLQVLKLTPDQLRGTVVDQATGSPAASIVRLARERHSLLIVMCTHTGMEKPRGKLGSVAEGVLREAPCPVVLVHPERGLFPWSLRRILLPHDGTPATAIAIGPAADLARLSGAELEVLHVAAPGARKPIEVGTFAAPRYLDQPQHEWPAWSREFLHRLSVLGHPPPEVKLRLFLATGEPGSAIVHFAAEHNTDLVVLGWHGKWEPERAATLKGVIKESPCPVLIVRVES